MKTSPAAAPATARGEKPQKPLRPAVGRQTESALEAFGYAQWISFAPTVFQAARTLCHSGVLSAVEKSGTTGLSQQQICEQTGLPAYGARVLVEAGLGIGLLREFSAEGNLTYRTTPTAYVLLHDGMTRANMEFSHDVTYHGMFDLAASVQSGTPEGLKHFGSWSTVYEALAHLPEPVRQSWFNFDHFFSDTSFGAALPLVFASRPARLLDIGGNTGKWALRCLRHDAGVQIGLLDLPGQLNMARANITEAGFADRARFHEANLLDETSHVPAGYDAIWMSQFLDCFSEAQITSILRRCREALAPHARIHILEPFWDRQRFAAAAFSLQMTSLYFTAVANGTSQMYRSSTFLACVREAGLVIEQDVDHVGLYHTLLTCRAA
jgi:hypothetical protein